jgi:DNA-binding NtrC family response regulator
MYTAPESAKAIVPSITRSQPRLAAPPRTAILASADLSFRQRVRDALTGLRWEVREAAGGAETLAHLAARPPETVILDTWLPDLEINEFITEFERLHAEVDLVALGDLGVRPAMARSPRRNEVLFALRRGQDRDGAAWNSAPVIETRLPNGTDLPPLRGTPEAERERMPGVAVVSITNAASRIAAQASAPSTSRRIPELIGEHPSILEVSRRIRLVAPHQTTVLVQGPSGTGKELVARALHRLSPRSARPFVALNCAAIPESLLEAELFGHTRGAFTGAVQGRTGRIEAAHGGTLFLDEIGEMPLAFQAKLLRFIESGELQRVGENETLKVDVRLIAATHRSLAQLAGEGSFRSDLYYRLSVFLIRTPPLAGRLADVRLLTRHFLDRMSICSPAKSLSVDAVERLHSHGWPGNVRELEHVLERAWILAEDRPEITAVEIEFGDEDPPTLEISNAACTDSGPLTAQ